MTIEELTALVEKPYTKDELKTLRQLIELAVSAKALYVKFEAIARSHGEINASYDDFLDLFDEALEQSDEALAEALKFADADIETAPE